MVLPRTQSLFIHLLLASMVGCAAAPVDGPLDDAVDAPLEDAVDAPPDDVRADLSDVAIDVLPDAAIDVLPDVAIDVHAEAANDAGVGLDASDARDVMAADARDVVVADAPAVVDASCGADTPWRCSGRNRVRCSSGRTVTEACSAGCLAGTASGDAHCIVSDPSWSCASSDYRGTQYWTCDGARRAIHRCDASGNPQAVQCEGGCEFGPLATNDVCLAPLAPGTPIPSPRITFVISGSLFPESAVRAPVEAGVRYMLDRYVRLIGPTARRVPDITLNYSPATETYCSGLASVQSAAISVPRGYPITGDNQNFVVNITIHEIGHIVAQALIAVPSTRDNCENEGLATWLAGRYWMNYASTPVASLREAARRVIAAGSATATMSDCRLASDPYYKVYGSFFEYLEGTPGAITAVGNGTQHASMYSAAWAAWLR